jgi:predicted metal-dependent hydrolase
MIGAVLRREARNKRGNQDLEKLALELLAQYLPDLEEGPASVTWRSMRERWGSCTTVDRTIRISDRLNGAPDYVLGCVLFHELCHLRVADHSEAFYALLGRFPELARAEAWLEGFEAGIALTPDSPVLS